MVGIVIVFRIQIDLVGRLGREANGRKMVDNHQCDAFNNDVYDKPLWKSAKQLPVDSDIIVYRTYRRRVGILDDRQVCAYTLTMIRKRWILSLCISHLASASVKHNYSPKFNAHSISVYINVGNGTSSNIVSSLHMIIFISESNIPCAH